MRCALIALLSVLPVFAFAADPEVEEYGTGLICPRSDSQISFYTENNQQDAAGTLGYSASQFTLTSDTVKTLDAAGAHTLDGICEGNLPGVRIDAKRDGWLKAGTLWLPPNQEWEYADWSEFLKKSPVWKPLGAIALYQGSADAAYKDRPYAQAAAPQKAAKDGEEKTAAKIEIYPLKVTDDFALVLVDESDAFAASCSGNPHPPRGRLGWMSLVGDGTKPVAVPAHPKGC